MKIHDFQFNMFGVNTYVVWDEATLKAALIDPGMISERDNRQLTTFIDKNHLEVTHLINTHLHLDHTFGNEFASRHFGVATEANEADEFLGQRRQEQARMFGVPGNAHAPIVIGRRLTDGDRITVGDDYLTVLAVPGHSPGSIALYSPTGHFVITGDALFQGSIGRTDLPGGNHAQLLSSIRTKLFTLPEETIVYPGHGPATSIGTERVLNPYF